MSSQTKNLTYNGVKFETFQSEKILKTALETANEMEQMGIIGKYAIAGSVALTMYAKAIDTDDLDLFFLDQIQGREIFSTSIDGVALQLIPSTGPLADEAIQTARSVVLFDVPSRVVEPEYLIALKLEAGRDKDFTHILHLLETSQQKINHDLLDQLISRFQLNGSWERFLEVTLWTRRK